MLSPIQVGTNPPQIPLALLGRRPDWLRAERDDLEVLAPESKAADNSLSQVPLLFLRRLSVDEGLRAELEVDPVRTLARHGIHVTPQQIPATVRLPPRSAVDRALQIYASAEDESKERQYFGLLGGLLDGLFGD